MSHGDIAALIAGCVIAIVCGYLLVAHWIRSDYQFTASLRIGKRNPPQPRASRAAEQPATVTDISKGAAA